MEANATRDGITSTKVYTVSDWFTQKKSIIPPRSFTCATPATLTREALGRSIDDTAIEIFSSIDHQPVLDYSLPGINGLQVAAILREVVPTAAIILFTFYKDAISPAMAHASGVASVISKGDQLTALADEVHRVTWMN